MSEFSDAVRIARKAKGISQQELGAHFGITKSAVNAWESGKAVPDQRKLAKLVEVLALDPKVAAGVPVGTETTPQAPPNASPEAAPVPIIPIEPSRGRPDVPVWASAQAGDDGALVLMPDPIDWIHRSERLRNVKNPFAFYVVGSSMSPVIEHGTQVVINPSLLPMANRDHVFIQDLPDGTMKAMVKRLIRSTEKAWRVRQFNELKDFDLPRGVWSKAYRISEKRED